MTIAAVVDELVDADRHSRSIPRSNASASTSSCGAGDVGVEHERQLDLRQRQPLAQPFDLLVLQRVPFLEERGRVREVVGFAFARRSGRTRARRRGSRPRSRRHATGSGAKQPLTTTGPSATPARSSIANAVSIDLAHRRLLGERHEHHLAALRDRRSGSRRPGPACGSGRPAPRRAGRAPTAGTSPRGRPRARRR